MGYNWRTVRAKPTDWNGRRYPSQGQARRAAELHMLQRGGIISDLKEEVTCLAVINGHEVTSWRVDFLYKENGKLILEDFKSAGTEQQRDYRMKVSIFRALGCTVRESGLTGKANLPPKSAITEKKTRSLKGYEAFDGASCQFELYHKSV